MAEQGSTNDEPKHWIKVVNLHKTRYSKPFIVPKKPPRKRATQARDNVPIPKLPHPGHLPLCDLKESVFRLYLGQWMMVVDKRSRDVSVHGDNGGGGRRGFTVSYLEQVPVLRDLAQRVVEAETSPENSTGTETAAASTGISSNDARPEDAARHRARNQLLQDSLRHLFNCGSIVIWDPLLDPSYSAGRGREQQVRRWDSSDTERDWVMSCEMDGMYQVGPGGVPAANFSRCNSAGLEEGEEAFVPLTYDLLYQPVVRAIRHMATSSPQASTEAIAAHLRRHFLVWDRLDYFTVQNVLEEMEVLGVTVDLDNRDDVDERTTVTVGVRNIAALRWKLVLSPEPET